MPLKICQSSASGNVSVVATSAQALCAVMPITDAVSPMAANTLQLSLLVSRRPTRQDLCSGIRRQPIFVKRPSLLVTADGMPLS